MKIIFAVVGKMKSSPEQDLLHKYIRQTPWDISVKEIEIKKGSTQQRIAAEGEALLAACEVASIIIALDECGKSLGSEALAEQFSKWQQEGNSCIACIIGGQDGLSPDVRKRATLTLSFGAMTWPHMMVRAMLGEQIYRIHTILSGHPYHRS